MQKAVEGLSTYDFSVRPNLEAPLVRELENCRWAEEEGQNIICVGRPGLGKSRVLDALAKSACLCGFSVCKIITAEMLEAIQASLVDGSYSRTFKQFKKYDVLYLDEFGYEPFNTSATNHLRHRKRSTLLAANTGFNNWKNLFPSQAQAVATVDRLIDRATILRFTGKSFKNPKEVLGAEIDRPASLLLKRRFPPPRPLPNQYPTFTHLR